MCVLRSVARSSTEIDNAASLTCAIPCSFGMHIQMLTDASSHLAVSCISVYRCSARHACIHAPHQMRASRHRRGHHHGLEEMVAHKRPPIRRSISAANSRSVLPVLQQQNTLWRGVDVGGFPGRLIISYFHSFEFIYNVRLSM